MGMFYQDRWNPVNLVLGRSKFWLKPHLRSSRSHCQSYWISSHFFFLLKNTTRCNHQEQRTNTADWQKERLGHSLDGRKKKKKKAFSEWEQVVIVTMTTAEIMTANDYTVQECKSNLCSLADTNDCKSEKTNVTFPPFHQKWDALRYMRKLHHSVTYIFLNMWPV